MSATIASTSSNNAWRSSPARPRSASASRILCAALLSRAETAWSNNCTTSSSTSVADCASSVSRIGYRRCGSRRANACAVNRRPTVARNRRRSAGSTDRSRVCASIPRRNSNFATSAFTAAGDASTGPLSSHRNRVIPTAGSTTSNPSKPAHRCPVNSCSSRSNVSRRASSRACATRSTTVTGPGRITLAEIRYSHANRNSNSGESCSNARASRNSSSSFNSSDPAARHPRYRAASRRCSVRVFTRRPYDRIPSGSTSSRSASRSTATHGTDATSSGTNPSHGNEHNATASPRRSAGPRPRPGSTNATSAGVNVKNRNSSSRPISGNLRSASSSSSANTCVATLHPQPATRRSPAQEPTETYPPDFREYYRDPRTWW